MKNNSSGHSFPTSAFDRMRAGFGGTSQAEKRYGPPPSQESRPSYVTQKPAVKSVEHVPSSDFTASDTSNLQAGQKVEHQKFGFGEVMKMEGSAHNPVATVKFEHNGEKKIMLNYAKLRILNQDLPG
jgi:DNA helicase-2/ATP-dependent DNA helicase PcrA